MSPIHQMANKLQLKSGMFDAVPKTSGAVDPRSCGKRTATDFARSVTEAFGLAASFREDVPSHVPQSQQKMRNIYLGQHHFQVPC